MYKSKLQEVCHQYGWNLPEYATEKDGPDHTPRFTATVTVNGLTFDSPTEHLCRSSKDAQNLAAQTAFLHFTAPKSISPSSGASTSNSKVDVRPPNRDIVQQRQNNIGQLSRVSEVPSARREPDSSKAGVLHLYKNRLQHYAQKQNLALPAYSFETDGPAHARRFRSKVTVDGKTYETQEFFSTLKEAEHAAAKVAFESLALNDIQEDEGLYKSLLQELAQKKGLLFPYYDTAKIGAPHMPIFRSTVLVGTGIFQGQEAKTKKQAETYAAKVAYNALMKGGQLDEPHKVLPTSLGYASDFTPVFQQKPKSTIQEVNLQKEEADTNTSSVINDPCPAASCSPDNQSSTSVVLHHSTMESTDSGKFGGTSILAKEKIFIFPRNASVELPKGASVMPYNDEKWVAASLDMNPNQ